MPVELEFKLLNKLELDKILLEIELTEFAELLECAIEDAALVEDIIAFELDETISKLDWFD